MVSTLNENGDADATVGAKPRIGALCRLLLCAGSLAVIWLVALPWLAEQPDQRARLEWLEERRIDPSAMYYTELEAMKPILDRLNRQER